MTINSQLPRYKEEVTKFTSDAAVTAKAVNLAQKAFSDGVLSIIQSNAKKNNNAQSIKDLNENLSDFYLDKSIEIFYDYFLSVISNVTRDGKLILNYEEIAKEDFRNIIKAVYDMGLIAGIQVAKDPKQLSVFLDNREKIESGKY